MTLKILAVPFIIMSIGLKANAQSAILTSYSNVCDSLCTLIEERTTVKADIKLRSVMRRGECLDFYFTPTLGDIPWTYRDIEWLRKELHKIAPSSCSHYKIGNIYSGRTPVRELAIPSSGNDGSPIEHKWRTQDPKGEAIVREEGGQYFHKGLSGRHLAIWQSHGRYYETSTSRWEWQRPPLFTTVEDMYTQSYVLPFLIPMLENAGAYVMTPRERDTQKYEVIIDNDPSFSQPREGLTRRTGKYTETGKWSDAGTGFSDFKEIYTGNDNPFTAGTARKAECSRNPEGTAKAVWTPDIPQRGQYAVYVSWKSLPNSSTSAHYSVKHLGGTSHFLVNQKIGGGTWIYLGTFEFSNASDCSITLDNGTRKGTRFVPGSLVTADGVKIGGGMGKIARGNDDMPIEEYTVSGLPSFAEGALYSMQWAGIDSTVIRKFDNDYTNDFGDRGAWVSMLSGGSRVNPGQKGKGIPFDLSLAFHSDAGVTPNDSTIGTLSIYTLLCDRSRKYPDGEDRMLGRFLAGEIQNQVVSDIRHEYEPEWNRRALADRSYSEARTTGVPGIILELLSHQNFADMKYGLDPEFRFTVSRSVYKGILKFLSSRYGFHYTVQPLPVRSFSAIMTSAQKVRLSWMETTDSLEQTASADGFILYTRTDDGAFDNGRILKEIHKDSKGRYSIELPVSPGHISSYRIIAFNSGGKSFPSETLSIGVSENKAGKEGTVLIVNNFTRIAPPAWFDTPAYAGIDSRLDSGVPYINDISFIGEMYQCRRDLKWNDDDNPGFGASFTDKAGTVIPGNTFDFPYIHGRALMNAGYSFCSVSAEAFRNDSLIMNQFKVADIICGKQATTPAGRGVLKKDRFQVFPEKLRTAIESFSRNGGNILISGANIGTDLWDRIYPVPADSVYQAKSQEFAKNILGYRWLTNYASRSGEVWVLHNKMMNLSGFIRPFAYYQKENDYIYRVETPDGLLPANENAAVFLRYTDTNIPAGICFKGKGYRTVSLGFPIETIIDQDCMSMLMKSVMNFFMQDMK